MDHQEWHALKTEMGPRFKERRCPHCGDQGLFVDENEDVVCTYPCCGYTGRYRRSQAERMQVQPTQLWFRPADADLETVKKIIGVTTDAL